MFRRDPERSARKADAKAAKKAARDARSAEWRAEFERKREEWKAANRAKDRAKVEALLLEGEVIEAEFGSSMILTDRRIIQGRERSIPYRSVIAVEATMFNGLRVAFGDGRETLADSNMTSRRPEFSFGSKEDRDAAKRIIESHAFGPSA
jgi:hypothetical protein